MKEDTIYLVLRKHDGARRILRTEIRGYEEGSRFIAVFRLGSASGPIRYRCNCIVIEIVFQVIVLVSLPLLILTNYSTGLRIEQIVSVRQMDSGMMPGFS